ncbi:hypothetical protein ACLKA7_016651 [Drosophila subpalustris]
MGLLAASRAWIPPCPSSPPAPTTVCRRMPPALWMSSTRTIRSLPGCDEVDLLSASKLILEAYSCSHNRAVLLYAESIGLPKSFPSISCSWKSIRSSKSCLKKPYDHLETAISNVDDDQVVYMGEQVSRSAISYLLFGNQRSATFWSRRARQVCLVRNLA